MQRAIRALAVAVATMVLQLMPAGPAMAVPLPADTSANGEWWFVAWDIAKVWAAGAQGQGVRVAVLDTGVNPAVAGLAGVLGPGIDITTGTGNGRTDRDENGTGHGTRMAAFIAGRGGLGREVGVAPQATILPVIVSTGQGDPIALFAAGIRWAADHGARVLNLSQAAPAPTCPPDVQAAVAYAVARGAVVVAAAGNEGNAANLPQFPANCRGVLSAGAVDIGRHAWPRTQRQRYVDVAAPGVHMRAIDSTGAPGYSDGTSDSAALVSGAIALVWSKFPRLTNRQLVARILASLKDDADRPGRDDATGAGIVRPYRAITQNIPLDAPNPVFDELGQRATATTRPPSPSATGCTAGPAACTATRTGSGGGPGTALWLGVAVAAVIGGLGLAVVAGSSRRRRLAPRHADVATPWPTQPPGTPPPEYHRRLQAPGPSQEASWPSQDVDPPRHGPGWPPQQYGRPPSR